jgi:hypothetical protein
VNVFPADPKIILPERGLRLPRADWREPRDWRRPWVDPPGMFYCDCCKGCPCPVPDPQFLKVVLGGLVSNGCGTCEAINGKFMYLRRFTNFPCYWQICVSTSIPFDCYGVGIAYLIGFLSNTGGFSSGVEDGNMTLALGPFGPSIPSTCAFYTLPVKDWNCKGINTMFLVAQPSDGKCTWPVTMEVDLDDGLLCYHQPIPSQPSYTRPEPPCCPCHDVRLPDEITCTVASSCACWDGYTVGMERFRFPEDGDCSAYITKPDSPCTRHDWPPGCGLPNLGMSIELMVGSCTGADAFLGDVIVQLISRTNCCDAMTFGHFGLTIDKCAPLLAHTTTNFAINPVWQGFPPCEPYPGAACPSAISFQLTFTD